MYAIVDVAGQQFKVTTDQKIFVHRLNGEEGDKVEFDKVLLIDNDDEVLVGEPVIKDALITGKILKHLKGDKVKVFKKKRRKGYKVLKGHRDYLSHVLIEAITGKGATKNVSEKETTKAPQTKKTSLKAEKAAPKAAGTKKPAAKSSPVKEKIASGKSATAITTVKKPAAKKAETKTGTKTVKKAVTKTTVDKKTTPPKKTKK